MRNKIVTVLMMVMAIIGVQSCDNDELISVIGNDLYFKAVNLSVDSDREYGAKSCGPVTTISLSIGVTINGETTTQSFTSKSNELLVMPGNEIEIIFYPSCDEETEATIYLPDGTKREVTVSNPSFKWFVPENFVSKMEITGESRYKRKGSECRETGRIILTPIN